MKRPSTDGRTFERGPDDPKSQEDFRPISNFFGLGAPSKIVSFGNHSQQVDITKY